MNDSSATTIRTASGTDFALLAPRPEQIHLADIARSLSMIARFNGHMPFHYSVAEHSIYVSGLLGAHGRKVMLAGLLHDAAEAYVGDVTTPMKRAMRHLCPGLVSPFDAIEAGIVSAIETRFDLERGALTSPAVRKADYEMFEHEWKHEITSRSRAGHEPRLVERMFIDAAHLLGVADA